MKKKYIIALEDRNVWSCGVPAKTLLLSDVSIFGTDLSSVNTGIELTPYTEPDLSLLAKANFERGYRQRKVEYGKETEEAYQRGLNDAWEAARKIALDKEDGGLDTAAYCETFGYGKSFGAVLKTFTASEAVEKIRQYEQEQEIQVGNEIKGGDERYVVLQKYLNNIDEPMAVLFNRRDGKISVFHLYNGNGAIFEKTGRHFPEIVAVFAEMKEES